MSDEQCKYCRGYIHFDGFDWECDDCGRKQRTTYVKDDNDNDDNCDDEE